jgi:hypothetical protein
MSRSNTPERSAAAVNAGKGLLDRYRSSLQLQTSASADKEQDDLRYLNEDNEDGTGDLVATSDQAIVEGSLLVREARFSTNFIMLT